MALKAIPKAWWSWTFRVFDDDNKIAEISFAWMREAGVLQLPDATYRFYRQGTLSGLFVLERNGEVIANAEKRSAMVRSFNVRHGGKTYALEAESIFRRKFVLREAGSTIGSIAPERAVYRDARIDLPVELPLPVRLFMVWLTLLLWKRERRFRSGNQLTTALGMLSWNVNISLNSSSARPSHQAGIYTSQASCFRNRHALTETITSAITTRASRCE